jgi:NAD-dependent DNA ligase
MIWIIIFVVAIILVFKYNKKTSSVNSSQKGSLKKKKFEFVMNSINEEIIHKFKKDSKGILNFKIDDTSLRSYVTLDNIKIGYVETKLFEEARYYMNNYDYIIDTTITCKTIKKVDQIVICIVVVKSEFATDLLSNNDEKEEISDAYSNGFGNDDFFQLKNTKFDSKYLIPRKDLAPNGHLFYGKKVVITGGLESFPFREELAKLLWEVGADIDTAIGKYTDIAIVGNYNVGPKKMEKIIEQGIRIIREKELIEIFPERILNRKVESI